MPSTFLDKGNASLPGALKEQVHAGAIGLKLHEDWGTPPAAISNCPEKPAEYCRKNAFSPF